MRLRLKHFCRVEGEDIGGKGPLWPLKISLFCGDGRRILYQTVEQVAADFTPCSGFWGPDRVMLKSHQQTLLYKAHTLSCADFHVNMLCSLPWLFSLCQTVVDILFFIRYNCGLSGSKDQPPSRSSQTAGRGLWIAQRGMKDMWTRREGSRISLQRR